MNDMKLKELLPVAKIEPRKPLKEILSVSKGKDGVYVGIDDKDDIVILPGKGGVSIDQLKMMVDMFVKTEWFGKILRDSIHRGVGEIEVDFVSYGIQFRYR